MMTRTASPPSVDGVADEVAAARGTLYALFAALFEEPDEDTYEGLASGDLPAEFAALFDRAGLTVAVDADALVPDDDLELLRARFNDVFVVGYLDPPVPLYETEYREESWDDVNLDLARVYDYFGVSVDREERDHHDNLVLELEFAGYLARRAAMDGDDGVRKARADFVDRHLGQFVAGIRERVREEPNTGIYEPLVALLDAFVTADRAALADTTPGVDDP
ncbi:molecular chaperone TorD family protein [Halobacteriaceae archaeon GCM10025711]